MNMHFDRQARLTRIYQQLNRENSIGAVWQLNFQTASLPFMLKCCKNA